MIQRINNVLVKHNKILFSILLVIIVIGFVLFFGAMDPGSFFSALVSGRNANRLGSVFGENVSSNNVKAAYRSLMLVQAQNVYAENPLAAQSFRFDIKEDMAFEFAVIMKAADKLGITASDEDVRKAIAAMPAFQKDGKFSQETYEKFKTDCLTPHGYNFEDFEQSTRDFLVYQKLLSYDGGAVTVTDDEVARTAADATETLTVQNVTFDPKSYMEKLTVTDAEIQAEYDKNAADYKSLPVSDAVLVYMNIADVRNVPEVTDAKIDEQYKIFAPKDKDGKPMPEKEAKAKIKADLTSAAKTVAATEAINKFFLAAHDLSRTDEFKKAPATALREAAKKAGFKTAELTKLTEESPAAPNTDQQMIAAICRVNSLNNFTQPVTGKDTAAFAMLTKRIEPQQLPLSEVKDKVRSAVIQRKAEAKALENARVLRADLTAKKVALDSIAEAAKKLGGTADAAQEFSKGKQLLTVYERIQNPQAMDAYLQAFPEQYRAMLMQDFARRSNQEMIQAITPTDKPAGFISEPGRLPSGGYMITCLIARTPAAAAPDQKTLDAVRYALTLSKKSAAQNAYFSWIFSNIKDFRQKTDRAEGAD